MIHFLRCKNLFRFTSLQDVRIQYLPNPFRKCHSQTKPPSSLFQYLQSSLGLPPERALQLSQRLRHCNPKNPDAVVTFLKSHGFSQTQVKSIIDRVPVIITFVSPDSLLRPKIEFLKEKGISESDLVNLLLSNPALLAHSLERHIKPAFDLLRSLLGTDELAVQFLVRTKLKFNPYVLSTNMTTLRNHGAQNHNILKLLMKHLRAFNDKSVRFSETVQMVKGMEFKPTSNLFVEAVITMSCLSREKWDAKLGVYASLGCSSEEILSLFRKQPICMRISENKIRKGFDYLTKELGWGRSHILICPAMLLLSLEKRIIPRHRFLQFLASKGFIKEDKISAPSFLISEQRFLEDFVMRYESEVPDILKIYENLRMSKLLHVTDEKEKM